MGVKWYFLGIGFVFQFWISAEFFKRNSLGFVLDSLAFFAGLMIGAAFVGFVGYWLCWYVAEAVKCQKEKGVVKGAVGLWATFCRQVNSVWAKWSSHLRGAKNLLVGIITTVFR